MTARVILLLVALPALLVFLVFVVFSRTDMEVQSRSLVQESAMGAHIGLGQAQTDLIWMLTCDADRCSLCSGGGELVDGCGLLNALGMAGISPLVNAEYRLSERSRRGGAVRILEDCGNELVATDVQPLPRPVTPFHPSSFTIHCPPFPPSLPPDRCDPACLKSASYSILRRQ